MSRDWTFYVEDILESALKIQRYTTGMTLETFRDNDVVFDAVVRNLELSVKPPNICQMKPRH